MFLFASNLWCVKQNSLNGVYTLQLPNTLFLFFFSAPSILIRHLKPWHNKLFNTAYDFKDNSSENFRKLLLVGLKPVKREFYKDILCILEGLHVNFHENLGVDLEFGYIVFTIYSRASAPKFVRNF